MPRLLQPTAITLARFDFGGDFGLLELLGYGLRNIVNAGGPDLLPHRHHAGQGDVQTAGDVDLYVIDHGLPSLVFEGLRLNPQVTEAPV